MTSRDATTMRPALVPGAVYWADNGRRICTRCGGASALYTGYDLSGQAVERVTADDVYAWFGDRHPFQCEAGCTVLSPIAGPDGWPVAQGGDDAHRR